MHVYLVQHGKALSKEEDGSRSLSPQGIEDVRKTAECLGAVNFSVRQILHSGKMRALQTAQILEEYIRSDMGVIGTDALAPMDDPVIWLERIRKMNDEIMLVGHLPYMAKLASLMLTGEERNLVEFEMGCILCLKRTEEGTWVVDWLVKPGMIK